MQASIQLSSAELAELLKIVVQFNEVKPLAVTFLGSDGKQLIGADGQPLAFIADVACELPGLAIP